MSALNGVVDDEQDEAPPEAKKTWQELVWDALAKPRWRADLCRIALNNGGTEPAATRHLKACIGRGSVVVVAGKAANERYQRVDCAGDGVGRAPTWAKPLADKRRETRPAVVEAEKGPLEDEATDEATGEPELDDDQDNGDDNEAPSAPVRRTRTMGRKPGESRIAIVQAVRDGHSTTADIVVATGLGEHAVHNACSALVAAGELVRVERGRCVLPGKWATRPSPAPKVKPAKASRKPTARAVTKPVSPNWTPSDNAFDAAFDRCAKAKAEYEAARIELVRVAAGGAS